MLAEFFQLGPIPHNHFNGIYDHGLVILSYAVATATSYIAFDMTNRLRDADSTTLSDNLWLISGAFAMGAGIWAMNFIGILAFDLPIPMSYDMLKILLSMIVAVLACGFALCLLRNKVITFSRLTYGSVILGMTIAYMHYIAMTAMNITIHYKPGLFILSIVIPVVGSEAALGLAMKSSETTSHLGLRLKIFSALIMGAAICGMHYTGMAAAVFTPNLYTNNSLITLEPRVLSITIGLVAFIILGIAFIASTYKEILNSQAVNLAHERGMSEVAANVLHNVGNVLNSINTSAALINESILNSELSGLNELNQLMQEHKHDLSHFVSTTRGAELPEYINILAESRNQETAFIKVELNKLLNNIQHIKDIITVQQSLSIMPHFEQMISIEDMLEECVDIASSNFSQHHITLKKDYEPIALMYADKLKLMQIMINLIRNAKRSLIDSNNEDKCLTLKYFTDENNMLHIQVIDNGVGISPENLQRIFTHGFTTKRDGHGFGLHASAIAASQMKGRLKVQSAGVGYGATFTVEIPYHPMNTKNQDEKLNDFEEEKV